MNLYLIKCRGMHGSLGTSGFGIAYVVAPDPTAAYAKLRADLDKRDIGFAADRDLHSIEKLAEVGDYPAHPCLYL